MLRKRLINSYLERLTLKIGVMNELIGIQFSKHLLGSTRSQLKSSIKSFAHE